jgi:hypothetical protein
MDNKETLAQFERLQWESEQVIELLRSLMPLMVTPQPAFIRRPRLTLVDSKRPVRSRRTPR